MKLILSCYKCGSTDFKNTKIEHHDIEGASYLFQEDLMKTTVICENCGLKDYVENLIIKFR